MLLDKLSGMRFPWRLVLFLLLAAVAGLLAFDIYDNDGFERSRTNKFLSDTGVIVFSQQVGQRVSLYSEKGYTMASPQEPMTSPEALHEFWAASGMKSQAAIDHVIPGEHYYDGIWYPGNIPKAALDKVKQFQFRDTDVVLATYPKSGTTWMTAILGEVRAAMGSPIPKLQYLEMRLSNMRIENIERLPDPRFYRTHLVVDYFRKPLATQKTKFIVINRNVKDTLVSYYHFYRSVALLGNFKGSFFDFMEMV